MTRQPNLRTRLLTDAVAERLALQPDGEPLEIDSRLHRDAIRASNLGMAQRVLVLLQMTQLTRLGRSLEERGMPVTGYTRFIHDGGFGAMPADVPEFSSLSVRDVHFVQSPPVPKSEVPGRNPRIWHNSYSGKDENDE